MPDQQVPECYIQIVFTDKNSMDFVPNVHGVSPMQLFAIAEYLRLMGQSQFFQEMKILEEAAQRNKIAVPGGTLKQ